MSLPVAVCGTYRVCERVHIEQYCITGEKYTRLEAFAINEP